jgi:hypothetical protein
MAGRVETPVCNLEHKQLQLLRVLAGAVQQAHKHRFLVVEQAGQQQTER